MSGREAIFENTQYVFVCVLYKRVLHMPKMISEIL